MKKLFIFASSMVIASMIYSADNDNTTLFSVIPLTKRLGKRTKDDALSLRMNLQDNTVQNIIDIITNNPNYSGLLLTELRFEGKDLIKNPGQSLADAGLREFADVYARFTDEEPGGEHIKGD